MKPYLDGLVADGKIKEYRKRDEADKPRSKHSEGSSTSNSYGISLDLPDNEHLTDGIDRDTPEKRTTVPCPPISEFLNNTLVDVFNKWKGTPRASRKICPAMTWSGCDLSAMRTIPGDGLPEVPDEESRRSWIEGCIAKLTRYPECMSRAKNEDGIDACLNDLAAYGKIKRYHVRDEGEKPRPKPRDADYYTDPSFFPYPMPPTPVISDELKNSLGEAFNTWRTSIANGSKPSCQWGSSKCNKADAITTKTDYTSKDKRKEIVEACIESLIKHPACLEGYYSVNVLKPYLSELVDKGKIKDEDGKIKKLWTRRYDIYYRKNHRRDTSRGDESHHESWHSNTESASLNDHYLETREENPVAPKLVIGQGFKDTLAGAFNTWKDRIANNSALSCPSKEKNACDTASNSLANGPNATPEEDRQHLLEMCISFLDRNPECFERYQTKGFIKPHLEELAANDRIKGHESKRTIHLDSKRYPGPKSATPTRDT